MKHIRRDCIVKYQNIMNIQAFWDATIVAVYQSTRRNAQKDANLQQNLCEKLESSINDP